MVFPLQKSRHPEINDASQLVDDRTGGPEEGKPYLLVFCRPKGSIKVNSGIIKKTLNRRKTGMKILIGADFAGFALKEEVKGYLIESGRDIVDIGMHSLDKTLPYYEVAAKAARKIQSGEADRGILFCGTGMGVSIVANKFKGIYASVVESEFTGERCKIINDANVLTMGGWVVSPYRAKKISDLWLNAAFARGEKDLEEFSDFLRSALVDIKKIEDETVKP
jgi:ribose 5-phosphate isomerase B